MENNSFKSHLGLAMVIGSVWGLSEVGLGIGLHACAAMVSGSVMTAVALFFLAAGWAASRRWYVPVLIILTACFFKLFDALLLSLPIIHGAIANPIFAFVTEGLAFLILISIFSYDRLQKRSARALLGGGAALMAVSMFPLVKFATTIPACVYTGTIVPLAIMFAPVAIILAAVTVPLGFYTGERIRTREGFSGVIFRGKVPGQMISPAALVICLGLVILLRLIIPHSFS